MRDGIGKYSSLVSYFICIILLSMLNGSDIQEFKQIYEEEFGEPISDAEAYLLATRVMALYEGLARPLSTEKAQFTDSIEGGRLNLEVGRNQSDEPPASEKVDL